MLGGNNTLLHIDADLILWSLDATTQEKEEKDSWLLGIEFVEERYIYCLRSFLYVCVDQILKRKLAW